MDRWKFISLLQFKTPKPQRLEHLKPGLRKSMKFTCILADLRGGGYNLVPKIVSRTAAQFSPGKSKAFLLQQTAQIDSDPKVNGVLGRISYSVWQACKPRNLSSLNDCRISKIKFMSTLLKCDRANSRHLYYRKVRHQKIQFSQSLICFEQLLDKSTH